MHVILFVIWQKRKKKLTREEDADYQASSNGAPDPGITDWPSLDSFFQSNN